MQATDGLLLTSIQSIGIFVLSIQFFWFMRKL